MSIAIVSSVLILGFMGSWHCGAMCGPISCNFRSKEKFASYHVGRLISYLFVASLLFLGNRFFLNVDSRPMKVIASVIFAAVFIFFGMKQLGLLQTKRFDFNYSKFQFKVLEKNKDLAFKYPIILGLLTGLFPCMWLYSFLILSSRMENYFSAAVVIILFWLTSLPAFLVVTSFTKSLINAAPFSYQKISGFILIMAGLFSVLGLWSEIIFL